MIEEFSERKLWEIFEATGNIVAIGEIVRRRNLQREKSKEREK